MAVKQFSVTPNLELKVGAKKYTIKPPSRDTGLIMQAINVAGVAAGMGMGDACPSCGRSDAIEVDAKYSDLVEQHKDKALGELSLGAAYQKMLDDGLDDATLSRVELYAFYYWTLGEEAADQITEQMGTGTSSESGPKGRKR